MVCAYIVCGVYDVACGICSRCMIYVYVVCIVSVYDMCGVVWSGVYGVCLLRVVQVAYTMYVLDMHMWCHVVHVTCAMCVVCHVRCVQFVMCGVLMWVWYVCVVCVVWYGVMCVCW